MKSEHMIDMNRYPIRGSFAVKRIEMVDLSDTNLSDPELIHRASVVVGYAAAVTAAIILLAVIGIILCIPTPAKAEDAPPKIKIEVTRAELVIIGQGVMKLPYETAAPVLNDLQAQLNAIDKAAAQAAEAPKAPPADK